MFPINAPAPDRSRVACRILINSREYTVLADSNVIDDRGAVVGVVIAGLEAGAPSSSTVKVFAFPGAM